MLAKSIAFGKVKIESINDIKTANNNLNNKFTDAATLINQGYPSSLQGFKDSVKGLTTAKDSYNAIAENVSGNVDLGTVQITQYPLEALYIKLGNYAQRYGVGLTFDLVNGTAAGLYNLNFKLYGSYSAIIDFIYNVENDSSLNFQIDNFAIARGGSSMDSSANTGGVSPPAATNTTGTNTTDGTNTAPANTTNSAATTQTTIASGSDTVNLNATFTVTDIGVTLDK